MAYQATTIKSLGYRMALFALFYTFSPFDTTPRLATDGQTDTQTDGHSAVAYTALVRRRAVKVMAHQDDYSGPVSMPVF